MNKEILEIAKHLKNKINSGEGVDEYSWQDIIDVCNELERIDNLEPVGYMESNGINYINQHGFTHINSEQSGSINIPLYKLD
ncbi:hypothetical protein AB7W85_12405 [Providencia rettgeri]|uniref:hypothetical protein n=1 Tax=unclassified Providencia TaxID=2633465 RepID=UPI0013DF0B14|nr:MULTISPECIES: hypothetical protein [unclassified Providencia]QIF58590.1 hypothetical protein FVA69_14575 [Providencia sp. 1701011]QIF62619.1 hypothetical protein FVA70_14595 [Providencia sp. 1701091]